VGEKRYARVENLVSVDLVSRPAANKEGVFRAGSEPARIDTPAEVMDEKSASTEQVEFDAKAAIEALTEVVSKLQESVEAIAADKSEPAEAEVEAVEEVKAEEAAAPEVAELSVLSAKVAELEIALAAKGSEAVASNGAASEDPVEQFKAASESKDWKRAAQIFSANKSVIFRARNANAF
jgi:cell division protein FtsN